MNFLHYSNLKSGDLIVPYIKSTKGEYIKSIFYNTNIYDKNTLYSVFDGVWFKDNKFYSCYERAIFLKTIFTNKQLFLQLYVTNHICIYQPGSENSFLKIG